MCGELDSFLLIDAEVNFDFATMCLRSNISKVIFKETSFSFAGTDRQFPGFLLVG